LIKEKVDAEIDRILYEQYERGMQLLTNNRDVLDAIAKLLIEEEKIDGKQLLNLIKSIKPEMVSEKAMDAIDQVITPTGPPTPAPQEAA
jgi:cell division protease FtsH